MKTYISPNKIAMSIRNASIAMLCVTSLSITHSQACSDVVLTPTTGSHVASARTLDFPFVDLTLITNVTIQAFEKGRTWHTDGAGLGNGKTWQSKYGFVGMHALGQFTETILKGRVFNLDGLNEAGLSAAFLWLEATRYNRNVPADPEKRALAIYDVVNYILSNFATVAEVKTAMTDPSTEVFAGLLMLFPENQTPPIPLHVVVHDAAGKSLIIEWLDGKQEVYDGPAVDNVGVLTNDPAYLKQVDNLAKYSGVTPNNGLLGIPGDASFQSRFVRLAKLREFASLQRGNDNLDTVQVAAHLINNVDVVYGTNKEDWGEIGGATVRADDYSGPTVIRDHQNRILYFKGHNNQGYRKINLASIDFTKPHTKGILADPLPTDPIKYQFAQDVTSMLNTAGSVDPSLPDGSGVLNLTIQVAPEDQQDPGFGSMFIYAVAPDKQIYRWWVNRWWPCIRCDALLPSYSGPLTTQTFEVALDTLPLEGEALYGAEIYAGYGASDTEMLLKQRQTLVYVITKPAD